MAMEFTYRLVGDKETIQRLRNAADGVINLSRTMKEIGIYLAGFFAGPVFASHGSVIGHPWQPLNDTYAVLKAEQYPGRPALVSTGKMINRFAYTSGNSWAVTGIPIRSSNGTSWALERLPATQPGAAPAPPIRPARAPGTASASRSTRRAW